MEDTLRLPLLKPVELGGQRFEHLDLCEPTAGQCEKAAAATTAVGANIILIAEVAKIPLAAARLLAKRDMEAAVEFLSGFTHAAPEIGEPS